MSKEHTTRPDGVINPEDFEHLAIYNVVDLVAYLDEPCTDHVQYEPTPRRLCRSCWYNIKKDCQSII